MSTAEVIVTKAVNSSSSTEPDISDEVETKWREVSLGTLTWKIPNFSKIKKNFDEKVRSPTLAVFHLRWCLDLYPMGCSRICRPDCIPIYLVRTSVCNEVQRVTYRICLKNIRGEDCYSQTNEASFTSMFTEQGMVPSVSKSVLQTDLKEELLPSDMLTIYCEFTIANDSQPVSASVEVAEDDFNLEDNPAANFSCYPTLSEEFTALYESCLHSDVKVIAEDQEYPVHKAILAARSSVFSSMLQEDKEGNQKNVIVLSGVKPEIAVSMFRYIYSGKVVGQEPNILMQLCVAAHKYGLYDLKEKCLYLLLTKLSLENFCEFLIFCKFFKDERLRLACRAFFRENIATILCSDEWKKFSQESPDASIQILEEMVIDYIRKLQEGSDSSAINI